MKSKRLAILTLIIMALVSTPRAMQQLRQTVAEAQQRAGLAWWNLLLTPKADAAELALAKNPCPKTGTPRATTYADALTGRSSAWPTAAPARQKMEARKSQRQAAPDEPEAPSAVASPELASNNNHVGDHSLAPTAFMRPPVAEDAARAFPVPEQLVSQVATRQAEQSQERAATKAQRAVAALEGFRGPMNVPVVEELESSEFASSPAAMNALLDALGKKGVNVQLKMKKGPEKAPLARPRGRLLISRDIHFFTFTSSSTNAEHQGI